MSVAAAVVSMQTSLRSSQVTLDAQKKRQEQCIEEIGSFQSKGSTLEQKRFYASCVQEVFPKPDKDGFDWGGLFIVFGGFIVIFMCGVIWNETFGKR